MGDKLSRKEIPLTGKLITSEDPSLIAANFRELTNMRYTETSIKGVGGHSKINSTPLTYPKVRSGIHFQKPGESHVLVEAYNSGETAAEIYQNTTAIPGTGDFTSLYTPTAGADRGRWSLAPDGYIAYCNGEETCIYGGDESRIGGFINYDPGDSFSRDYTNQISDSIPSGSGHVATLKRVTESTSDDALLLHMENNVTDSSATTVHTVTNNNVTFSSGAKKFGSYGAVFNGTTAYLSVPDNTEFDFSGGTFCIDGWVISDSTGTTQPLYHQGTVIESVTFSLGENEISAGDTVTGKVSSQTAIVDYVDVTGGTWAGGDASGTIYVHTVSGVFSGEVVTVSGTDSATIGGDFSIHGENYISLHLDTSNQVCLVVHECYGSGADVIDMSTPVAISTPGVSQVHIEVNENGDDWYIFVDGDLKEYVSSSSRAKNYIGLVLIGSDGTNFFEGKIDEYRVSTVTNHVRNFEVPTIAYGDRYATYLYIGSLLPISGVKFYISTANTSTSTTSAYFWTGSEWEYAALTDGTASGGVSFAQTGSMTFTGTSCKVKEIDGVLLYWYRFSITDADDNIGVYKATSVIPFQPIKDMWDGIERKLLSFYKYTGVYTDYTGNVREDDYSSSDTGSYINIHGLTSAQSLVVGFSYRQSGLRFNILGAGNITANTGMEIYYWDGSDWVTVGALSDGTAVGAISLSQAGLVTWGAVDDGLEFETQFSGSVKEGDTWVGNPVLYYYKVVFNKTLSGASSTINLIQVTGVPAQETIAPYKFPFFAMDRLWLFSNQKGKENTSICSSESEPTVFNGDDSIPITWGDEGEITGAGWLYSQYGSSIYNIMVVFKKDETWVLVGSDPSVWSRYRISSTIGCVAPETIRVIDLPSDESKGVSRSSVILFQGANGIYMTDGRPPTLISGDIGDLFTKRLGIINQDLIDKSFAFVDQENSEYHWCFAKGPSIDSEMVLDYSAMKWFNIDRPSPLQAGIETKDTNGVTYSYGAADEGYVLRLEHGNDFDGTDIEQTWQFGDIAIHSDGLITLETDAEYHILIAKSKTTSSDITVTHYGDTSTTGTNMTISPVRSGYRAIQAVERKKLGSHVFHSWKFSINTNDETCGFEPLFFACLYRPSRDYTRDYRS